MNEVLLILLGWLFGLLSPAIAERIRRKHRQADLVASVVTELSELQYTLIAALFKLRSRLATVSDEFVDLVLPIVSSYQGPAKIPDLADNLVEIRKFPEDQRRQADLARRDPNAGIALKQYDLPFLASQGADISICALDFQRRVYRIKGQLDLFNQQVTFLQKQYERTFDTGITIENRRNLDRNLEDGYARLSGFAEQIVRAVSDVNERYQGAKKAG